MASDGRNLRGSLSLDELIALNDEILALVRAGVPLELGLRQNAGGLGRRLNQVTDSIADRLARGADLGAAIEQSGEGMPAIYKAMVIAGMQSGRLGDALEGLTRAARHLAELRRLLLAAMVYPLVVFLMAYGLFIGMLLYVLPALLAFAEQKPGWLLQILGSLSRSASVWGPIVPLVVIAAWLLWLYQTSRAMSMHPRRGRWLMPLPIMFAMGRDARYATFAELLALLVEHGVPLDRGLRFAGEAAGDPDLTTVAAELASDIGRGAQPKTITHKNFPTLVSWALASSRSGGRLAASLHSAAASYQQRVLKRADMLRIYLPAALTLCIGGTATVLYAVSLFAPFTDMLLRIAAPNAGL